MSKRKKTSEYTTEFRENAVRKTRLPGRTIASVAEELNIPAWRLHNWIRDSKAKLERSSDMDEMASLHNENKELKEQVEILKNWRRILRNTCSKVRHH